MSAQPQNAWARGPPSIPRPVQALRSTQAATTTPTRLPSSYPDNKQVPTVATIKTIAFPEFDYSKIKDQLCSAATFARVLKEVNDTNDDFLSLRTDIIQTETVGILHFVQYPADGALCNKPIFGRIIFNRYYPSSPPVVHIFTRTDRYNVDIFNSNCYNMSYLSSSACFDILKTKEHGGTWVPDITISALLASLLQSIVSVSVPQQYGGEIKEFVTMEKLEHIHNNVQTVLIKYERYMPPGRVIEKFKGHPIETDYFSFPRNEISTRRSMEQSLISEKFVLSNINALSIEIDLSDLQNNLSTVFSIVMTTNPNWKNHHNPGHHGSQMSFVNKNSNHRSGFALNSKRFLKMNTVPFCISKKTVFGKN
jgi:ubiquitin-protein ligase